MIMNNDTVIRDLVENDLAALLTLYGHLHPDDTPLPVSTDTAVLWKSICADEHYVYIGAFVSGQLVSVCNAAVILNLTRNGRPYALVENVVTHPDYRRRGYGKRIMKRIFTVCGELNCYKIMLLSNALRTEAHAFYRSLGFDDDAKKAFILTT